MQRNLRIIVLEVKHVIIRYVLRYACLDMIQNDMIHFLTVNSLTYVTVNSLTQCMYMYIKNHDVIHQQCHAVATASSNNIKVIYLNS